MKLALIGQGYWGSKISSECQSLGIDTDVYEIDSDLSKILPTEYFGCIVATPAHDHVETSIKLLENKNNLLIEKPIAMNTNELNDLKNKITSEKIMVGHILLYNDLYKQAKANIKDLKHIHTRRNAWGRLKTDISPILNLAPHDVALLDDIFHTKPISVYSHGVKISGQPQPDTVFCFLEYDKVDVTLELGWYNHTKIRETNFICEDKHIIWNDVTKDLCIRELYLDDGQRQKEGKTHCPNITQANTPLCNQIRSFQDFCLRGIEPITNLQHAQRVTEVVDSLEESLRSNKKIWL